MHHDPLSGTIDARHDDQRTGFGEEPAAVDDPPSRLRVVVPPRFIVGLGLNPPFTAFQNGYTNGVDARHTGRFRRRSLGSKSTPFQALTSRAAPPSTPRRGFSGL